MLLAFGAVRLRTHKQPVVNYNMMSIDQLKDFINKCKDEYKAAKDETEKAKSHLNQAKDQHSKTKKEYRRLLNVEKEKMSAFKTAEKA